MMFMNEGKRESRGGKEGDTIECGGSGSDGKDVLRCKSSKEYCEVGRSGVRRQPSCADDECRSFTNSAIQADCPRRYSWHCWPLSFLPCWQPRPLRGSSFIALRNRSAAARKSTWRAFLGGRKCWSLLCLAEPKGGKDGSFRGCEEQRRLSFATGTSPAAA